jgi:hypothetical protein
MTYAGCGFRSVNHGATAAYFRCHHQDALAYSIPWQARNKHDLILSNDNVGKLLIMLERRNSKT